MINIISSIDWNKGVDISKGIPFDIDGKISYNELDKAKVLIEDHKIHHHRLKGIYDDFDKSGVNKSLSVLNGIQSIYLELESTHNPDKIFYDTIKKVIKRIMDSANYSSMPIEELELCVQILVVDTFIKCKIFKNPMENPNAGS